MKQRAVEIKGKDGKVNRKYYMPSHLMVRYGEVVSAHDVLAKIPRETTKTKDITAAGGGLFEAAAREGGHLEDRRAREARRHVKGQRKIHRP